MDTSTMFDATPEDLDAERTLLTSLCDPGMDTRSKKLACAKLTEKMFMNPFHQELFRILRQVSLNNEKPCYEIDFLASQATTKMLAMAGGRDGFRSNLFELLAKSEMVGRLEPIVDIVIETHKKRLAHFLGIRMVEQIYRGVAADEVLFMAEEEATRIQISGSDADIKLASAACHKLNAGVPLIDPRRARKLIYTGLPSLDDALLNLPGTLGVVAATPGGGKSTLMVQAAYESAKRGGKPMLVSLEMDGPEVESRLIAHATGEDHRYILLHGLPKGTSIGAENLALFDNIYYDCDLSGISWPSLEARISQAVIRHGVDSVWVDYMTLMNPPELKGRNMAASYGEITKACKRTAQKLGIAIVMVSQFNRLAASEPEPQLHHLRETGQLEQDATWCAFMWERDGTRWIKLAKNRSGSRTLKRRISFNGGLQKIIEYSEAAA